MRRHYRRLVLAAAMVAAALVTSFATTAILSTTMTAGSPDDGTEWDVQLRLRRSLGLSEYLDPKTVTPAQGLNNFEVREAEGVRIHFFVKATGRYLDRSTLIADTWAREATANGGGDAVTFLVDNVNRWSVDNRLGRSRPWISIAHVGGTSRQGWYKGEAAAGYARDEAYRAQRIKTRAVFDNFLAEEGARAARGGGGGRAFDWICYLDDDMVVNATNLGADLAEVRPRCAPDCLVADGQLSC